MSEDVRDQSVNGPKPEMVLDLNSLRPEKVPVPTSVGELYVRNAGVSEIADWCELKEPEAIGKAALKALVGTVRDKLDREGLEPAVLSQLSKEDIGTLVQAASSLNRWGELTAGSGLAEFGSAVEEAAVKTAQGFKKHLEAMKLQMSRDYSFLSEGVVNRISEQMSGFAALKSLDRGSHHVAGSEREESFSVRQPGRTMGDQLIEAAQNTRIALKHSEALVEAIGDINVTLVREMLPRWTQHLEDGQRAATVSFTQARASLVWAKWTLIISVAVTILVTIGATYWQVHVAKAIDKGNTDQLGRLHSVMEKQLEAQDRLIRSQAAEAAALRSQIETLEKGLARVVKEKGRS